MIVGLDYEPSSHTSYMHLLYIFYTHGTVITHVVEQLHRYGSMIRLSSPPSSHCRLEGVVSPSRPRPSCVRRSLPTDSYVACG
jgi:hypothetical protein